MKKLILSFGISLFCLATTAQAEQNSCCDNKLSACPQGNLSRGKETELLAYGKKTDELLPGKRSDDLAHGKKTEELNRGEEAESLMRGKNDSS